MQATFEAGGTQGHGKGTKWVHSQEGNICQTHFAPNGNICLAMNTNLLEDGCECILYSVMPPDELVFLAIEQVVSKGVKGFTAHWTWCATITRQDLDAEPPPQKQPVLGGTKLQSHAFVWRCLHPRSGVGH